MHLFAFMPRAGFILALTAAFLFSFTVAARPGDTPQERATLKGITAVKVTVGALAPDAERNGLTRDQLQTDVELRLRKADIRIDPSPEEERSQQPYLILTVATSNSGTGLYTVGVNLNFYQSLILERDPSVRVLVPTWSASSVGSVGISNIQQVRYYVSNFVDQFINAYLEQNPKK